MMNADLLRQRRNLLLVSSILIMIQLAGITIERISILGTVLKVERIEVIVIAVWVIWFYLFIRYYQYLRNEKDLKIAKEYFSKVDDKVYAYFFKVSGHKGHHPDYSVEEKSFFTWWYREHRAETPEFVTPFYLTMIWKLMATFHVAINTSSATDHLLPIVIGIAPFIIWVVKNA